MSETVSGTQQTPEAGQTEMDAAAITEQQVESNDGGEATNPQPTSDESQTTEEDEGPEPADETEGKKISGAEKRIKALLGRAKHEEQERIRAEQERDYFRRLAEQQQPQDKNTQSKVDEVPNLDNYPDWETYQNARDNYLISKAKEEVRTEFKKQQEMQQSEKAKQRFSGEVAELYKTDPEKFYKLDSVPLVDRKDILDEIARSDNGVKILEYLAENTVALQRLRSFNGSAMYRELGRLEAILEVPADKPKPKKISSAPDPITPVSGRGTTIKVDPSKMTMAEYATWRDQQVFKGR